LNFASTGFKKNDFQKLQYSISKLPGLNLGLLYSNHEEHEKSIRLLERHFDLARQMQDRETIDRARVILGIARGNGKLDLFFHLCKTDLGKLLEWKSRRAPLE